MKLDCVLTSVNENPLYINFVPFFIKTWNKLYPNVDIKIILIANEIPLNIKEFEKFIILFKPIKNISTSFISQYIRLLYPCLLEYKNGVMITDIDMIPMNRKYYTDNINQFDNDKFIYYRENICFSQKQIAMCYNVATPAIWKQVFDINSLNDIINRLKIRFESINYIDGSKGKCWFTDQLDLYEYIMKWNNKYQNLICLKENYTKFKRLENFSIDDDNIRNNITNGIYTDYHCYRPMDKFSELNYTIFNLL